MEESSGRRRLLVPGLIIGGLLLAVVLYWFAPQTLFLGREVDEALPGAPAGDPPAATAADATPGDAAPAGDAAEGEAPDAAATPTTVASGSFSPLGRYEGTGTALLLDVDGTSFVRFEDFETTNGPDLRVYLSAAPADADASLHDDDFADLGPLTASRGAQNYEIPADVDPSRYQSVVVWCRRFSVGFAVAPLS